jgi:hypothetical protein
MYFLVVGDAVVLAVLHLGRNLPRLLAGRLS